LEIKSIEYDFLIIGAGIMGMSIANELLMRNPNVQIIFY